MSNNSIFRTNNGVSRSPVASSVLSDVPSNLDDPFEIQASTPRPSDHARITPLTAAEYIAHTPFMSLNDEYKSAQAIWEDRFKNQPNQPKLKQTQRQKDLFFMTIIQNKQDDAREARKRFRERLDQKNKEIAKLKGNMRDLKRKVAELEVALEDYEEGEEVGNDYTVGLAG